MWVFQVFPMPDHTRRRCDQACEGSTPAQNRIGVYCTPFKLARSFAGLRCCAHTHTLTCVRNNNNTQHTTRLNQVAFPFLRDHFRSRAKWSTCRCMSNTLVPRVRRERRMRSFWRHEQMAIQMVLASVQHTRTAPHGDRRQPTRTRGGGQSHEMKYTAKFRRTPLVFRWRRH